MILWTLDSNNPWNYTFIIVSLIAILIGAGITLYKALKDKKIDDNTINKDVNVTNQELNMLNKDGSSLLKKNKR